MPSGTAQDQPLLADVVAALGGHVVQLLAAPRGLSVPVTDVVMYEPDEDHELRPGDVVLVVGARAGSARPLIAAAGRAGAPAVVVRMGPRTPLGPIRDAAEDAGVALLVIGPDARWERVFGLASSVTTRNSWATPIDEGDMFGLARTLMHLTGGSVSIEDTSNRVVAYATLPGEADELRVHSILGRRGPDDFLSMLRGWGVYEELRIPERVVEVAARPELGWRFRLAVGIFAGQRPLGTIWLQEASRPLVESSRKLLLGATRLAATSMAGEISGSADAVSHRRRLLSRGLSGELPTAAVASQLGLHHGRPACLVAVGVSDSRDPDSAIIDRSRVADRLAVHGAAYRTGSTTVLYGSSVFLLVPMSPTESPHDLIAFLEPTLPTIERGFHAPVYAALTQIDLVGMSLHLSAIDLEQALDHLRRRSVHRVTVLEDIRSELHLRAVVRLTGSAGLLEHRGLASLRDYDARRGTDLTAALRCFLDSGGDVALTASTLQVHPNTVRYRIRRAIELADVDLANPDQRILLNLSLRLTDLEVLEE